MNQPLSDQLSSQAKLITLPKIGESIHSAQIVRWMVNVGDSIGVDEALVEVSTDKVNSEIPSPIAGVVSAINASIGVEVDVGAPICSIMPNNSSIQNTSMQSPPTAYLSPAVMTLMKEHQLSHKEISEITPTGHGGRVSKKDVEKYLAARSAPIETGAKIIKSQQTINRANIAANLTESIKTIPQASLVAEVDMTQITRYIHRNKQEIEEKQGIKLTVTAFIAYALAQAAMRYPLVFAQYNPSEICQNPNIHLGIAVHIEDGLIVPVIKQAEQYTVLQMAKEIKRVAIAARAKALSIQDVQSGNVTLTNFGMSGILLGTPIIPPKQAAIVGVGAIHKKVVPLEEGSIGVRERMYLSLTFDHRLFDGMYGCAFLHDMQTTLEHISILNGLDN